METDSEPPVAPPVIVPNQRVTWTADQYAALRRALMAGHRKASKVRDFLRWDGFSRDRLRRVIDSAINGTNGILISNVTPPVSGVEWTDEQKNELIRAASFGFRTPAAVRSMLANGWERVPEMLIENQLAAMNIHESTVDPMANPEPIEQIRAEVARLMRAGVKKDHDILFILGKLWKDFPLARIADLKPAEIKPHPFATPAALRQAPTIPQISSAFSYTPIILAPPDHTPPTNVVPTASTVDTSPAPIPTPAQPTIAPAPIPTPVQPAIAPAPAPAPAPIATMPQIMLMDAPNGQGNRSPIQLSRSPSPKSHTDTKPKARSPTPLSAPTPKEERKHTPLAPAPSPAPGPVVEMAGTFICVEVHEIKTHVLIRFRKPGGMAALWEIASSTTVRLTVRPLQVQESLGPPPGIHSTPAMLAALQRSSLTCSQQLMVNLPAHIALGQQPILRKSHGVTDIWYQKYNAAGMEC